jgi:hypothetical protein
MFGLILKMEYDLRDGFGHNVWFDLKNGIFYFFVTEN